MKDLQESLLKESILDDENILIDELEKNVNIKTMVNLFQKGSNLCKKDGSVDKFGRELNVGDLVYCPDHDFVGIGVITNIKKPGLIYDVDFTIKTMHTNKLIQSYNSSLILIPKKYYKEFIKIISEK